ncbi:MAG: response regulator transcription factor [Candidatus Cloacimonetes bacterium]|jgi:two-component system, LytTR family, response regulator LytT|nr:response regulator transcription factor [Candidatus Cloacimonadota bacterium]
MMNVLIFEDEQYVAKRLIKLLDNIGFEYNLMGIIGRVSKAVDWLKNNPQPDLIFADIQLSDGTSFNIFDQVKVKSYVIFTTSYDEYAIQAFKVNSIDYLLKPITEQNLKNALEKMDEIKNYGSSDNLVELLEQMKTDKPNYKSRFLIKIGINLKVIEVDDIAYFFMEDKLNFLMTNKGKKNSIDHSLEELENLLDSAIFFRVNRQMVINVKAIKGIQTFFNSRLLVSLHPEFNRDVIVTRSRVVEFKEWLNK